MVGVGREVVRSLVNGVVLGLKFGPNLYFMSMVVLFVS